MEYLYSKILADLLKRESLVYTYFRVTLSFLFTYGTAAYSHCFILVD